MAAAAPAAAAAQGAAGAAAVNIAEIAGEANVMNYMKNRLRKGAMKRKGLMIINGHNLQCASSSSRLIVDTARILYGVSASKAISVKIAASIFIRNVAILWFSNVLARRPTLMLIARK
ncbi:unnamed protein product [Ceratitis capitata]|uniref:(Mediterranean fruit fly) hypothetical protein n=1 Tax=Ceratitis capitata TaxID=7213 RepID=A0A811V8Y9_CERCA|nr:unnamed protein product [Ceratitis capitata]